MALHSRRFHSEGAERAGANPHRCQDRFSPCALEWSRFELLPAKEWYGAAVSPVRELSEKCGRASRALRACSLEPKCRSLSENRIPAASRRRECSSLHPRDTFCKGRAGPRQKRYAI